MIALVFLITELVLSPSSSSSLEGGMFTCKIPSVKLKSNVMLTCYSPENYTDDGHNVSVYFYTQNKAKDNEPTKTEQGRSSAVNSSCTIESVKEMEPASLTCKFSTDVNMSKTHFKVVHLNGQNNTADEIVNCTWIKDKLNCTIAPGYEFNKSVTDRLVINIPQATSKHSGTYSCRVTGSHLEDEACEFNLIPEKAFLTHLWKIIYLNLWILVLVLVLLFIIVVFLIFVVVLPAFQKTSTWACRRKNDMTEENSSLKNDNEMTSMLPNVREELIYPPDTRVWQQWAHDNLPDLDSRSYFLPLDYKDLIAGQDTQSARNTDTNFSISHRIPTHDSEFGRELTMQRIIFCLRKLFVQKEERLVGLSQLQFGLYKDGPCYAAAARLLLPVSDTLSRSWKSGCFDLLLIHPIYGLIICEVLPFGDFSKKVCMSEKDIHYNAARKLQLAVLQLDKVEDVLPKLASNIAMSVRITKTIVVPNLTSRQIQQTISTSTELANNLRRCLGTNTSDAITGLCLCSDQLSDPKTPCDVSSHVLRELGLWWQRRVTGAGPDPHMTQDVYKTLVSSFCGPAVTTTVSCTSPPRLGQAVWWTGECYTAVITLFPEQVHLLHTAPPRIYLTGPPGTGKTVVLLLMAIQWLCCGHDVYIVSTWYGSRAACSMLYHMILQTIDTQQRETSSPGFLYILNYDFNFYEDMRKAVDDLSHSANEKTLRVIADEAGPMTHFQNFCGVLLKRVPHLHLWATCCYHSSPPVGWQEKPLTRLLRCLPDVDRKMVQNNIVNSYTGVQANSARSVSDNVQLLPVKQLYHGGQGHLNSRPIDCVTCGREMACFLHSLRAGVSDDVATISTTVASTRYGTAPPSLQWKDMLMLYQTGVTENAFMVEGLREAGIPVRVMKDEDIEDVATARSDVVWVTSAHRVRGLERKVVVCLDPERYDLSNKNYFLSRCTSHLAIVSLGS
ncbi:uncharacterized protein LOC112574792 isoform X2 [Pomacea canaliculata]|uniref:uncharacterized protein LOC112574792 isoform X2 n=1 Tax=Pomacea canaliculata TaxID=400727 RepID=UPI000D73BDB9|nr:uncharacterized protein LOC112574792 isoform X2 [Pomacea canaliculata]